MGLFTNLFGYRRTKRYDFSKTRKDSKLNGGFNYQALPPSEFIGRSLSGHIQRNETIQHFLIFLDDALKNLLKGTRYLKNYKNYTVKEDDNQTR
jgi:hypothetical protein|tara:strand:+ start:118 stop:399 length:282 start_codon:yes stop_codon:yes gene_type:complete